MTALPLPSSEYETFYLFGPLPTKEVADLIESSAECACRRSVVPIFFPKGVTMMLAAIASGPAPADEPIH
jgi:hypothetical protein